MDIIDEYYEEASGLDIYNQIAYKFFNCYSRFEYALKVSGFVYTKGRSQVAMADLNGFVHSIEGDLDLNSTSISEAVNYLLSEPPNEWLSIDGSLVWGSKIRQGNDTAAMVDCIRTVRNNLFHGNKMSNVNNLQRNIELINACLIILNELLSHNQSVQDHFLAI